MKTFQLSAEPRTDLGKKAAKALRKENKIPVVLNGGEVIDLPYNGKLRASTPTTCASSSILPTSSPSSSTSTARNVWLS